MAYVVGRILFLYLRSLISSLHKCKHNTFLLLHKKSKVFVAFLEPFRFKVRASRWEMRVPCCSALHKLAYHLLH
jgi:hypothetical protein